MPQGRALASGQDAEGVPAPDAARSDDCWIDSKFRAIPFPRTFMPFPPFGNLHPCPPLTATDLKP